MVNGQHSKRSADQTIDTRLGRQVAFRGHWLPLEPRRSDQKSRSRATR